MPCLKFGDLPERSRDRSLTEFAWRIHPALATSALRLLSSPSSISSSTPSAPRPSEAARNPSWGQSLFLDTLFYSDLIMLDDFIIDKRGLHRRVVRAARNPLKHRVFTPTAVFTPFPSETTTTTVKPPGNKVPTVILPTTPATTPTTSTTPLLPIAPTVSSSTTSIVPITTPSSTPIPTPPTTSTSSSTVVTPTVLPPTTTSSTTPLVATSTPPPPTTDVRVTVTQSKSLTSSATSLAASPTATTAAKSSVSSGVLIGGIVAVVIAVAGIVFAVVYFIRRNRKAGDDDFNPDDFRRQSVMLPNDDGASGFGRAMGWNQSGARPPTMIEQKLSYNPASYAPPMPAHPYGYGSAYNNQPSYSPGQMYTPTTANSANPFFSPYDHSPMTAPLQHETFYDARGNVVSAHPSMASSTVVLSRRGSGGLDKPLPDVAVEGEYVTMSRSSVTPFQAAQYADISRHLNVAPPDGLPLTPVTEELGHAPETPLPDDPSKSLELQGQHLAVELTQPENAFPESPFANPDMAEQRQRLSQRESTDSILPPPPAIMSSPKARIPSIPPMLPELTLQGRSFSPVTMEFPAPPSTIGRPGLQLQSSPLAAASPEIPSPPPNVHLPNASAPVRARASEPTPQTTTEAPAIAKRPETVYDDEDAYGGI